MAPIPQPRSMTTQAIDAHHEARREPPRPHMGCSELGAECDRWLWLKFRWAVLERIGGRTLRLFRRGHREEPTVLGDLRAIGCVIDDGDQQRVDFGCHVSGSVDGVIRSGVPEASKTAHILEIKTHSAKSFNDLEKNGVQKSKPRHWVQMQCYMHGLGIDRALYFAVCKDDDRLYTERVRLDKEAAEKAIARGKRLAIVDEMPDPLSRDPAWHQCKMCAGHGFCHGGERDVPKNCRTCAHSTAKDDGTWRCEHHDADGIPLNFQRIGCDAYEVHDHMRPEHAA
jgi:hypothetical protein